jgi:hypothetical protein
MNSEEKILFPFSFSDLSLVYSFLFRALAAKLKTAIS